MRAAAPGAAFPWREVMGFALGVLRLSPAAFWTMTPREFASVLDALPSGAAHAPGRAELAALMQLFPDGNDAGDDRRTHGRGRHL